jgi:hypothetical protein
MYLQAFDGSVRTALQHCLGKTAAGKNRTGSWVETHSQSGNFTVEKRRPMYVYCNNCGAFAQPLLPRKSKIYYIFRVCVCSFSYPACKTHALYNTVTCGCLAETHFSTLSNKRHDFRKQKYFNTKCVILFFLQLLYETFLILRKTQRDSTMIIHRSSGACGGAVVKALRYKPAGRGFDSWWCH